MSFPARRELLEQMLRDGQLRRAPALSPPSARPLSTGVPALDSALGGGLLRGHLHELIGPPGAGGTALLRAALAAATCAGETCALIDPGNTFDPAQGGIDLLRLLWVRPRDPVQALRAAEIALEARFSLVALDLGEALVVRFEMRPPQPGASPWARLARRAEKHGGVILLLARASQAGTFAAATIELERGRAQWEGRQGAPGRFLRGAQSVGAVARHKRMPPSLPLPLSLLLEPK